MRSTAQLSAAAELASRSSATALVRLGLPRRAAVPSSSSWSASTGAFRRSALPMATAIRANGGSPRWSSEVPSIRSLRGFVTSASRGSQASETAAASAAPSEAVVSTSQFGFAFLEPWAPTLHSLVETLHFTGPHAHALSIVVLAFSVRTVFTLPMTIWQRKRTQRMTELVVPEWKAYKEKAPNVVRLRCRRAGKSYEEFEKELQADLKAKIRDLLRQHKCSPLPSFLAPFAVHLPVFLMLSALIRQAALVPGSPFAAEILPWWSPSPEIAAQFKASAAILADRGMDADLIAKLQGTQGGPTLTDRDNTMIGPVSLGMLTMTNIELTSWSRRALAKLTAIGEPKSKKSAAAAVQQPVAIAGKGQSQPVDGTGGGIDDGEDEPRRTRILTNAFRVLAIASIPIASQAPGALIVYWLSSGAYTLLQNSVFAFLDRQREARKVLTRKPPVVAGQVHW